MASAEFNDDSQEKRPTVQVGDPFTEKLLLEACLELMATDAIIAIQDMGAAGLTSSAVEMSAKGGLGIELDLDQVPMREAGMTAYEIMLSESQERMLMVLRPAAMDQARAVFAKWELDFAEIGRLTDSGRLVLRRHGAIVADLPVQPLVDEAPLYQRPWTPTPPQPGLDTAGLALDGDPGAALIALVGCPDLASKRWVWEQYDHLVMGNTVQRPGGDAAIVRLPGGVKGLALATDCTPRYCQADPRRGGAQAVAESWRNLTAVGAMPIAITDNMNFGNPQRPEIMGQFVGCIEGMREACLALDYPVVSGNVSLYNETNGKGILPTPAIGGVGLLADVRRHVTIAFAAAGEAILLIGKGRGHLGCSLWLREIAGREDGPPPDIDFAAERRHGDFVRGLITGRRLTACHDLADGGLAVGLAEMAMAGGIGARLEPPPDGTASAGWWFGEDQARYLVTLAGERAAGLVAEAGAAGIPVARIGETGGDALILGGARPISLSKLKAAHEAWLPRYMGMV
jgi:phosphoribosylformylglycinamidine synthase